MDENKRAIPRLRSLKGAKLISQKMGFSAVDCRIVDINSRGAKLRFTDPFVVDDRFELIIFPENKRVKGRKRWQVGVNVGVEFETPLEWLAKHETPAEER